MSSTPARGSLAPATEAKGIDALSPVSVVDSPLSKSIVLGRPVLLFALLYLRFHALVADPVSTLRQALPAVAVIQSLYAVVCLPVAGSQNGKAARKPRPGEKKKSDATTSNAISTAVLSLLLAAISTPAVHVLFILFGAPFLDHVAHTLLCAAHFSLLGLFPIFYSRGVDSQALVAVAGASAPLDETFGSLVGAVVGAWLGAVPIPLDWDREWQKWPVTVLTGMYVGSLLLSPLAGTILFGKKFSSTSVKDE